MTMRSPENLDHTRLWQDGCVKSRLKELEALFESKLQLADIRQQRADRYKASILKGIEFKPPTYRETASGEIEEKYGEKARKKAQVVLRTERFAYVEYQADRLKGIIELVMERLRPLVFTVDENGKAIKVTQYTESVVEQDYKGDSSKHDIQYIENRGSGLLDQYTRVIHPLGELRDYVPYMTGDLKKLYHEVSELATIKHVRIPLKAKK